VFIDITKKEKIKMKHKITLTTEECFEVVDILGLHIQRKNVDKDLLSAYKKLNVKIPNVDKSKINFDYVIKDFEPRK
jgi:aspartokinase